MRPSIINWVSKSQRWQSQKWQEGQHSVLWQFRGWHVNFKVNTLFAHETHQLVLWTHSVHGCLYSAYFRGGILKVKIWTSQNDPWQSLWSLAEYRGPYIRVSSWAIILVYIKGRHRGGGLQEETEGASRVGIWASRPFCLQTAVRFLREWVVGGLRKVLAHLQLIPSGK